MPNTNASPTICTGIIGMKIAEPGMCKAADARSIGPTHGRKLTPAAIDATHARMRRSIPSRV